MGLQLRPLTIDPAMLKGLPEKRIVSHQANNYIGAVKRLNAICLQLDGSDEASLQSRFKGVSYRWRFAGSKVVAPWITRERPNTELAPAAQAFWPSVFGSGD